MGKLKDVQIRNWVKSGKVMAKSDGDGLTFTLSAKGTAAWVLRYRMAGAKSQREVTLGRYPDISLGEARRLATEARAKVHQGVDLAREKQRSKQDRASAWSVKQLAEDYMTKAAGRLAETTIASRRQQVRDYILPLIGNLPAREVRPADIVDVAEKATVKSLHVARLVLVAVREIFAHGVARHVIETDPCAPVRSVAVIGPRPVNRTRIMLSEDELAAVLPALPAIGRSNELAVKILLATCTRIGELIRAEWGHIDFEARTWMIPPEHSKNGKRFVIPLSDYALQAFIELQAICFGSRYVLPLRSRRRNVEGDRPMEPTSLNAAINRLCAALEGRCRRFTPHDLRSTARSHLGAIGVDVVIAERCLNHSMGGLVEVYDQHDYLNERRRALDTWCDLIQRVERGLATVVLPFQRTA